LVINALLPHYTPSDFGLSFSKEANHISFYWMLLLAPIIVMGNWFVARKRMPYSIYRPLLMKKWCAKHIGFYFLACSLYLFAFELLFRGFLFFPQVNSMGVFPAIFTNVLIYTISQAPKGVNETIGKLFFGLVLCLATLQTGTIWVAFLAQALNTISTNLFASFFHPEMRAIKAKAGSH
jgi:membrane protease YdiL (CAAX protease family)